MTKTPIFGTRHYKAYAEYVRNTHRFNADREIHGKWVVPLFQADNPKFKPSVFIKACIKE